MRAKATGFRDSIDELVYYLACLGTLGAAYVIRIIITTAIRKAGYPSAMNYTTSFSGGSTRVNCPATKE
jgi:hypothetical protein